MSSQFERVNIRRDSLTHNILMITKVYDKLIGFDSLKEINPQRYSNTSKVSRSLLTLSLHGLIHLFDDDTWIITDSGKKYLHYLVGKYPRPIYSKED